MSVEIMAVAEQQVMDQLRTVNDPELQQDLVALNMIKKVVISGDRVKIHVELTTPACPLKETIHRDVVEAVRRVPGVQQVDLEWSSRVQPHRSVPSPLPGIKHIVAVGAGKGGVGKSTVAVLLAVGLQREGATVGLLDADVYGPSIPKMMGIETARPELRDVRIIPVVQHGIRVMSMGFLLERDRAVIWRGPMVHGAVKQLLDQVEWGELDYLIVDLPPGTGDVPLTLAQSIPMTGAVVVCTPQDVALMDARRAIQMYQMLDVPCLGIIENMSFYVCPHCGHRDEIFDHGGARRAAEELGVPFLGALPLNSGIRVSGDRGDPVAIFTAGDSSVQQAAGQIVRALAGRISIRSSLRTAPVSSAAGRT